MATVISALRGKIGNTVYYESTMKVQDFVRTVERPRDMDPWADFGIEDRMQRIPDLKRVESQLAPYIANSQDRFFGSIIVLIYEGDAIFEPIAGYTNNLPPAYLSCIQNMGFLTISGGELIVLDGQHRQIALKKICRHEVVGEFSREVVHDDICVIFIEYEDNQKTRRIFNTVNRYAKQTSRGDNIITSEDDGYAIVSRGLLLGDAPFGGQPDIVNWRSNTLTHRSAQLTTISAVYETVKLILDFNDVPKLKQQTRPPNEDIQRFQTCCNEIWATMLEDIEPYRVALEDPTKIPSFRKDESITSLLFKPAAQIALVDGMLQAMSLGRISLDTAIDRVNMIKDWSMEREQWQGVIIKRSRTIDASQEARRRMAKLVCYLIASDKIPEEAKFDTWKTYNFANGKNLEDSSFLKTRKNELLDLPSPVQGNRYTSSEGLRWLKAHLPKD